MKKLIEVVWIKLAVLYREGCIEEETFEQAMFMLARHPSQQRLREINEALETFGE